MRIFASLALLVTWWAATLGAQVPIYQRTGVLDINNATGVCDAYVSWTQTGAFTDVSITAFVTSQSNTIAAAYLMSGATPAQNQLATTNLSLVGGPDPAPSAVKVFSGMTLPAGTYYLIISRLGPGNLAWGIGVDTDTLVHTSTLTLASGVSENPNGFSNCIGIPPYPPAASFDTSNHGLGNPLLLASIVGVASPTGTISVKANLAAATFIVTGPASFSGSGASATFDGAPAGTYSITFGAVAGYNTAAPQTLTLAAGGAITFSGNYSLPVGSPVISLSKESLDFGFAAWLRSPVMSSNLAVGLPISIPPTIRNVVITNKGNANLVFAPSAFSLSPESSDYMISGNCSPDRPLAPDAQCTVTIEFNPQGASTRSTTLMIASNAPAAQSVSLTGIGMNVFYQFGAGTDPSAVPACFDIAAASENPNFRKINGIPIVPCSSPPAWANANTGYDTGDYGCLLMSTASALSTFQSDSLTTPAILDPSEFHDFVDSGGTDPENGLYWPLGSGDITPGSSKIPQISLESCSVAGEVLTGGCNAQKGTPLKLNQYLYQKVVVGKNPVVLQLAEGQTCTSGTHYVSVIAPVDVTVSDGGGDWLLFDPGWQAANTQTNYLLSQHQSGFWTNNHTKFRQFSVCGVITFMPAAADSSSLAVSAFSPVELLVTDSQGRRLGNVGANEDVSEIPQSSYSRDFPIADDVGSGPPLGDPTGIKTAFIPAPATGSYQLLVTGTAPGTFTLTSRAGASDGSVQTSSFTGITSIGVTAAYQIQYSPVSGTPAQFSLAPSSVGTVPPSQISATASGLAYSRVSQTFNGTVTIENTSTSAINGPFQIILSSLTAGVTLANATNTFAGVPYLTVPATTALGPGRSATASVQFVNPAKATINFTPVIYSGRLN